jgi:hypothetical protein
MSRNFRGQILRGETLEEARENPKEAVELVLDANCIALRGTMAVSLPLIDVFCTVVYSSGV